MTLNPAQIDSISDELKSMLRVELKSKKVKKIEPGFYKNVVEALQSLNSDAQKYLLENDISNYIKIKERIDEIERTFKSFYQRRFEKILVLSIYDLESDALNQLTPEEREFAHELHNLLQDEYKLLLNKKKQPQEQKKEEEPIEYEEKPQKEEIVQEEKEILEEEHEEVAEKVEIVYIPVRIVGDQPPIAQPDRNYYLHDSDVVYLPESFAEILIKRNAAVKLEI